MLRAGPEAEKQPEVSIGERIATAMAARGVGRLDTLVAVGRSTAYAREVLDLVRREGLEERVRLLRGVTTEELAALYRLAAVVAYPSVFEGFGLPIVEALASGTPVVTTRGGVFPEAGGPGSAYVDPDRPEELRATLAGILADPDRRAAMRAAGLVHAERFRDERIADAMLTVYREACEGTAANRAPDGGTGAGGPRASGG